MTQRVRTRRGSAVIEFTLVGIPLIFTLISIFEISRGMWIYHTLAYSVTEATRFASVHGLNCTSTDGNSCSKTISDIASIIQYAGVGLGTDQLNVTFTDNAGALSCNPLRTCLSPANTTVWPRASSAGNMPGMNITIQATYPFSSAIAMFWPGAGAGIVFPAFNLPATSTERVQF